MVPDLDDVAFPEGVEIDIDPELIAAAVSAVETRQTKRKRKSFAPSRVQEETGDPVTVDLEAEAQRAERTDDLLTGEPGPVAPRAPPRPAPAAVADERPPAAVPDAEKQLLVLRLRDTTDRLRRLEAELLRTAEQRDAAERSARELREAAQRVQSENEAIRVRARKDREEVERSAEERVLRGLLDVVENVERGLAHARQDPARVQAGLTMVAEQFHALLRRLSIDRIVAEPGTLFDPALHEALLHVPTGDYLPGCIVNEVSAGFLLRGRMMRPARVVVASAPPAAE